uniref:Aquaporin n=1 Tax=Minutocellus polymorphus TaxID=265543 RepID=A0A6U0J7A6_9STRA|mmetsp:Transcript_15979/g.26639  ORF Transcript_15979/g.26639 Transcript_15979/m.26639 type:complete len:224 (+) Transcript_15979:111-782(+)
MQDFRRKFGKATMELVGTFILLFTIQLAVSSAGKMAPVPIGLALMSAVYAGGPISGAHYNPAVSLAVFLRGKSTLHEMLIYWAFQIAGGFVGACLGGIVGGDHAVASVGNGYFLGQALLAEVIWTFVLCFVVLGVATNSATEGNSFFGAAIGLTVTAGAFSIGGISGGAFNPAVALSLSFAKHLSNIPYSGFVALANLLGGALAAAIFYFVAPPEEFTYDRIA